MSLNLRGGRERRLRRSLSRRGEGRGGRRAPGREEGACGVCVGARGDGEREAVGGCSGAGGGWRG